MLRSKIFVNLCMISEQNLEQNAIVNIHIFYDFLFIKYFSKKKIVRGDF